MTLQLITDHPALPQIIADSFQWQVAKNPLDLPVSWVDTNREIVSLPHFSYGFHLSDQENDYQVQNITEVHQKLINLHHLTGQKIQLRLPVFPDTGETFKVSSWLKIIKPWYNNHLVWPGNLGRKIRKACQEGFHISQGGTELLNVFYKVYEQRLHEIGSAALPLIFFKNLLERYPDLVLKADARIYVVFFKAEVVGGAFCLRYDNFMENTWFATLGRFQKSYVSYLLHAVMIEDAAKNGCMVYSFGRSTRGSGVHKFKKQWGAEDVALYWLRVPETNLSLKNFPGLMKWWRWVPLQIARPFNNLLSKWLY